MEKANSSIREIPIHDRPRERLIKFGPEVLSNSELLAVLIHVGTKELSALTIAQSIIGTEGGLQFLSSSTLEELSGFKGIGSAKAAQLKAAVELGRRLRNFRSDLRIRISKPCDAVELLMEDMRYLRKEHLKVIFLNTKNQVIFVEDLSIGSLSSSVVHPREIYCEAIRRSASSIIVAHNHPSGDPAPSQEDINITKRLHEVGKLVGIELLDHLIIGDGIYVSLKEKGVL